MRRWSLAMSLLPLAIAATACTSTQDVLEPSALQGSDTDDARPRAGFPLAEATNPAPTTTPATVAAVQTSARIQFAPVVGATNEASAPMAARLSARATERGITLLGAGDKSATHIMKGYFSTIADGEETTVIYVWDVLDPAGTRVHRIQGQAKAPAAAGDGWSSVQPATMEAIADQTVEQLAAWLVTLPG